MNDTSVHYCLWLEEARSSKRDSGETFKSNCICIKYVSMKNHVTRGSCNLYSEGGVLLLQDNNPMLNKIVCYLDI